MSATLSTHRIKRFVLHGRTPYRVSVTAMPSATEQGYAALVGADWRQVEGLETSLPPHDWTQTATKDQYDAYKFCGDYSTAERAQHAFMGAVAYRVAVPADAKAGAACDIEGVSATVYGCRWLADGAIMAVIPSISATPPTWAEILAETEKTAALMAVTPANDGTDSTATASVTLASAVDATTVGYVWVCLRLADYSTHRGAWIEGGAMLDAASLEVTYSRAVTADGPAEDDYANLYLSLVGWQVVDTPVVPPYPFDALSLSPNKAWILCSFTLPDDQATFLSKAGALEMRVGGVSMTDLMFVNGGYMLVIGQTSPAPASFGAWAHYEPGITTCQMRSGGSGLYIPLWGDPGSPFYLRNYLCGGVNRLAFEVSNPDKFVCEISHDNNFDGRIATGGTTYLLTDGSMPEAATVWSKVWFYGRAGQMVPPASDAFGLEWWQGNYGNSAAFFILDPSYGLANIQMGTQKSFTVRLYQAPGENVVITTTWLSTYWAPWPDFSDDNAAAKKTWVVAGASLTFTPANWNTPQTVTVQSVAYNPAQPRFYAHSSRFLMEGVGMMTRLLEVFAYT